MVCHGDGYHSGMEDLCQTRAQELEHLTVVVRRGREPALPSSTTSKQPRGGRQDLRSFPVQSTLHRSTHHKRLAGRTHVQLIHSAAMKMFQLECYVTNKLS